jgi:hypothetical protein
VVSGDRKQLRIRFESATRIVLIGVAHDDPTNRPDVIRLRTAALE